MLGEALLAFEVMSYGSEVVKIGTKDVTQKLKTVVKHTGRIR